MPVKERGILYKGEMVQAVLRDVDPKTQTRRVVKPQPDTSRWKPEALASPKKWRPQHYLGPGHHMDVEDNIWCLYDETDSASDVPYTGAKCPYGKPGDRLWVRETWTDRFEENNFMNKWVAYRADSAMRFYHDGVFGKSDASISNLNGLWRPSIFMPRWASRIDLEVLSIRVERLQDISEEDARAEGVERVGHSRLSGCSLYAFDDNVDPKLHHTTSNNGTYDTARMAFAALWDSINAAPKPCYKKVDGVKVITHYVSYPWEDVQETRTHRGKPWHVIGNPWNWVIEFKRVEGV